MVEDESFFYSCIIGISNLYLYDESPFCWKKLSRKIAIFASNHWARSGNIESE